ncbi:MAG TPA: adenine deaminase [Saprospiraceae bacterium]|nr:adenine deaminase [Saprospiraceae bacterium]
MDTIFQGNLVNIKDRKIQGGKIIVRNGRIIKKEYDQMQYDHFILPGFIDSHVHIESSMLVPREFARIAVMHGTIATLSDPHEIANVLGVEGVRYMIENGKEVPLKFHFGAPSCVPATTFESAGAVIDAQDIEEILSWKEVLYLAEMMNYPGVLFEDKEVMKKIAIAKKWGKPVDGHAPGLMGDDAIKYIHAGISTDHECFKLEEALHKITHGMKIIIREGSAAKNFEELWPLIDRFPDRVMFCSDDLHPDNLMEGHINVLVKRALQKGCDLFNVLNAASINPVQHYRLPVGILQEGDPADFIRVRDLQSMHVLETWIDGECVYQGGKSNITFSASKKLNHFNTQEIRVEDLKLEAETNSALIIVAQDGQLITGSRESEVKVENGAVVADLDNDILKIVVINRYSRQKPAIALIHGFGLKGGAIASCVAHDSHNIIAVGVEDTSICESINAIIQNQGGISAVNSKHTEVLPLPIAGIMSNARAEWVAESYKKIDKMSKEMGSTLKAPFMTLSFMALLVIPSLKLSDKGLFNGEKFEFVKLYT